MKGVATIPAILAIIVLIVALSIGVSAVSLSESFITAGHSQSSQALLYAEAGARDALIRIARNKNYSCATADCYSIDLVASGCTTNDGCAKVSVSAGVGSSGDPKVITSKGIVKNKTRRVEVRVVFDAALNGEIQSAAWTELTN